MPALKPSCRKVLIRLAARDSLDWRADEAVFAAVGILQAPDDFAAVVDAVHFRADGTREVDVDEAAAGLDESVRRAVVVDEHTHDLPRIVEAQRLSDPRIWRAHG